MTLARNSKGTEIHEGIEGIFPRGFFSGIVARRESRVTLAELSHSNILVHVWNKLRNVCTRSPRLSSRESASSAGHPDLGSSRFREYTNAARELATQEDEEELSEGEGSGFKISQSSGKRYTLG